MSVRIYCNVSSPHPLLFVLCVCEQLPDVGLGLSNILVENLGPVDDLRLPGLEHLADLSSHQGFAAAWGSEQEDSLHMLTAWRHRKGKEKNTSHTEHRQRMFPLVIKLTSLLDEAQTDDF